MSFYYYLFYRMTTYYNYKNPKEKRIHAFIMIGAIIVIHILSIILFLSTLLRINLMAFLEPFNPVVRRFIILPILILPVYLLIYLYTRLNAQTIDTKLKIFKLESNQNRKRGTRLIFIYLIISILILLASMTSPIWIKCQ